MSAVTIKGLETFYRRLAAKGLEEALQETALREAKAIQEEAAAASPGRLGETIEVVEENNATQLSVRVGTDHRAGRFLEFGTRYMRAQPFLWPAFRGRLPQIKHELTNTLRARLARP